jgi:pilus assembly protein CpaB
MKRYGVVVALGLALLSGAVAVFLANQWMKSRTGPGRVVEKEKVPTTQVVIAARDLALGSRLTADALTVTQWPAAMAPRGTFEQAKGLEGRVVLTRLWAGQPILSAELAAPGSAAGLVATIKPGKRAMAIRVDETVGVAGFVLPHTFVDVIALNQVGAGGRKRVQAKTLLEAIEVLAIAQQTVTEEGKPKVVKTVTLELTPEQATQLAAQTHTGAIQLVLRNPAEEEKPPPIVAAKGPGVPVLRARVRVPPRVPYAVEIIRGSKKRTIRFKHAQSDERID